jgi:hypothetical protein
MSFLSRNFMSFYKLPTAGCDMSRPPARTVAVVTAASDAALTPTPAFGSRLVSCVIIVILVKHDSRDEDMTSSIESMSFTSIGTAVEVLAKTLTLRAATLQRYLQRRARSAPLNGPHFVWHFVSFLPTPESYIVLHIFFANVATFGSEVETFVTFSTFALCYGHEFTGFAL